MGMIFYAISIIVSLLLIYSFFINLAKSIIDIRSESRGDRIGSIKNLKTGNSR